MVEELEDSFKSLDADIKMLVSVAKHVRKLLLAVFAAMVVGYGLGAYVLFTEIVNG